MKAVKIRKINKLVPILLSIICLSFVFTACFPPARARIYGIGDEWRNDDVGIILDSVDCEKKDDITEMQLNFTITPVVEWSIKEEDMYFYVVANKPIYPIKDKSIELNGYNIFETPITNESSYTFVFQMPISSIYNETEMADGKWKRVGVHLRPATFYFVLEL